MKLADALTTGRVAGRSRLSAQIVTSTSRARVSADVPTRLAELALPSADVWLTLALSRHAVTQRIQRHRRITVTRIAAGRITRVQVVESRLTLVAVNSYNSN